MDHLITDPTDFTNTKIPILEQWDTLLRCHICKDFLKVPVLTPCGHTFCSLCIRKYINNSAKCPLCLSELRDSMLRSEFLVNELVECYTSLRPSLLNHLQVDKGKQLEPEVIQESSLIEIDSDPEIKIDEQPLINNDDIQIVGSSLETSNNRITTAPKSNKIVKQNNLLNKKKSKSTVESMFNRKQENKNPLSLSFSHQQLAQCPICQDFFPLRTLERSHLDECLSLQSLGRLPKPKNKIPISKTTSTLFSLSKKMPDPISEPSTSAFKRDKSSSPSYLPNKSINHSSSLNSTLHYKDKPQEKEKTSYVSRYVNSFASTDKKERLPKLDYSNLSMHQLRQKLNALNLPSSGSRQTLIERYNYYEMIWNSNFCDSLNPVDESDLKRQLASWEASNIPKSGNGSRNTIGNLIQRNDRGYQKLLINFRNDKFDRKAWIHRFSKEFRKLIKEAKLKYKKPSAKNVESNMNPHNLPTKEQNDIEPVEEITSTQVHNSELNNNNTDNMNDKTSENKMDTEKSNAYNESYSNISIDDDLSRDLSQTLNNNS